MATYKLTLTAGTNSTIPIFLIEETDGTGTLIEDQGNNLFMAGKFDCKYRPESLSMDITTISGRSISLVYANIDTYDILNTSTGLTTMYLIWKEIADLSITNF